MAIKPILCDGEPEVFVPDEPCTDCEEIRAELNEFKEEMTECCDEVKTTLENKQNKLIAGEHISLEDSEDGTIINSNGGMNTEFGEETPTTCVGDNLYVERQQSPIDTILEDYPLADGDNTFNLLVPQEYTNKYVVKLYQGTDEVYAVNADFDTLADGGYIGEYIADYYTIVITRDGDYIKADLHVTDGDVDMALTMTMQEMVNTKTYVCDNGTPVLIAETKARGNTDIDEDTVINILRQFLTKEVLLGILGATELPIAMTDDAGTENEWLVIGRESE